MVVFVHGAQLPLQQRDCAVPTRARAWEAVKIPLSSLPGSPAGHPGCGQCPGEGSVPSQPGGHTWVL